MKKSYDLRKYSEEEKPGGQLNITMNEWRIMRPLVDTIFRSDKYYLGIAQKIVHILVKHEWPEMYSCDDIRRVALCLAAYFEDQVSELGLFRTFVKRYREVFHKDFPFYKIEEEYFEDEVNSVDVRFILWLTLFDLAGDSVPDPEIPSIEKVYGEIYDLLLDEFENAPVNQKLLEKLYDPKILEDAGKIKELFIWMSSTCYLLPIMPFCREHLEREFQRMHETFEAAKKNPAIAKYLDLSYAAFAQRRGPLALFPKEWYVLMRQSKGLTQGNRELLEMELSPLYPFVILKDNGSNFLVRSCRGVEYKVDKKSFSSTDASKIRVGNIMVTMLLSYKGKWNICGFAAFDRSHDVDSALEKLEYLDQVFKDAQGRKIDMMANVDPQIPNNSPYGPTCDAHKCEELINRNNGDRMFYFSDKSEAERWVRNNFSEDLDKFITFPPGDEHIALYISPDCHLLLCGLAQMIHDPRNVYYSTEDESDFLRTICEPEFIPYPMIEYMLERNYTDRLSFSGIHGKEQSLKLMQDNIRFFLSLARQYPFYDKDKI